MSALLIEIGRLDLRLIGWAGHGHRVRPVVRRAVDLLRSRLDADGATWFGSRDFERLTVPVIEADLAGIGDEGLAERLADALYDALQRAAAEGRTGWPS